MLQDGTIKYEIKLTGELSTNPLSFGEESPEYGTLVMEGVNAQHHQHMFCARLDMAVDDQEGGKGLYVSEVTCCAALCCAVVCIPVACCAMPCCAKLQLPGRTHAIVCLDQTQLQTDTTQGLCCSRTRPSFLVGVSNKHTSAPSMV